MLFEAKPEHIQMLDSTSLVHLMKRLMLAESRLAGIPLRVASVPLQITVPDGGEDGRVEWTGGEASTAYFPNRYTIFQSKAQKLSPASLKKETHGKGRGAGLNEALSRVLSRGGAYIVFCKEPYVGERRDKLIKAIREGIKAAGGDPNKASAIDVYDANLIADWVNTHPPVALWLASLRLGQPLQGFQTHESWSRSPEIADVPWQESDAARFRSVDTSAPPETLQSSSSAWTYKDAATAVRQFLAQQRVVVRVQGPSGFGKTRFVYELLAGAATIADEIDKTAVMFADGSISGNDAVKLALEMADAELPGILVIDECDDELHGKLTQMVQRVNSRLCLITMNIESAVICAKDTLALRLERTADTHIQEIAKGISPSLSDSDTSFIAELAAGFPRVAVLAAQRDGDGRQTLNSAEQLLDRVIWSFRPKNGEAEKVLQLASLFEWIGIEGPADYQVRRIATQLARIEPAIFVEHLLSFVPRGVVTRRGDFVQVGPIPLAARLGLRRLSFMTVDHILKFFEGLPEELKATLLKRMQWLDTSPVARAFAQRLLEPAALGRSCPSGWCNRSGGILVSG